MEVRVLLLMLAVLAVVGCLLYLPFYLWFRRRRPSGDGALSAKVNFTPMGWLMLCAQLAALLAGLLMASQASGGDFGYFLHRNAGLAKWWICTVVVFSVAGTLLRGAGIALERPASTQAATTTALAPNAVAERPRGRRVATIRGVPVFVHRSFLFGGLFIALMATTDLQGIIGYCLASAALLAIHESGHAVVARRLGLKVHSIDLSGIGGLCRVDLPVRTRDIWMVFSAGLAAQAIVMLATIAVVALRGAPESPFGIAVMTSFTWVNAMLFLINLMPGKTFHGNLTDGAVLWGMARHQFGKGPRPLDRNAIASPVFDPSTSLLDVEALVPEGFRDGVEIFNDDTTPMEFVIATLERHAGMSRESAISAMLDIHRRGGLLLPRPSRGDADAVAEAIAHDVQAQGHRLVCRAVTAGA